MNLDREKELLIEIDRETENFRVRLNARIKEINSCKRPTTSRLRGELKHRAVVVKSLLAEYRRG